MEVPGKSPCAETQPLLSHTKLTVSETSNDGQIEEFDTCCCYRIEESKSKWGYKIAMVVIHVVYIGGFFLLDSNSVQDAIKHPWYTGIYLLLAMVTLLQYFLTVLSQPGYVPEVLHELTVADAKDSRLSLYTRKDIHVLTYGEGTSHGATSNGKHPSHVRNTFEGSTHMPLPNRNNPCQHCKLWQPLRSRHCHDCDKCVLKFDHHCALLGTCIGQGNHCRFWWYILAESTLCTWTSVKYIISIHTEIYTEWWHGGIEIILVIALILCLIILLILLFFHSYLVLTNQTTYELIRRHRIPYLRTLPNHIHPFSKGILRNLKEFCCPTGCYTLYSLPTREELEHKIQPYTCQDVLSCRCC